MTAQLAYQLIQECPEKEKAKLIKMLSDVPAESTKKSNPVKSKNQMKRELLKKHFK